MTDGFVSITVLSTLAMQLCILNVGFNIIGPYGVVLCFDIVHGTHMARYFRYILMGSGSGTFI